MCVCVCVSVCVSRYVCVCMCVCVCRVPVYTCACGWIFECNSMPCHWKRSSPTQIFSRGMVFDHPISLSKAVFSSYYRELSHALPVTLGRPCLCLQRLHAYWLEATSRRHCAARTWYQCSSLPTRSTDPRALCGVACAGFHENVTFFALVFSGPQARSLVFQDPCKIAPGQTKVIINVQDVLLYYKFVKTLVESVYRGREKFTRQPPIGEKYNHDYEKSWISEGLPSSSRRRSRGWSGEGGERRRVQARSTLESMAPKARSRSREGESLNEAPRISPRV